MDGTVARGVGFARSFDRHGDRPALLLEDGQTVSYADLDSRVATFLAEELSPAPGLLAIAAEVDLACIIAYLAALRGGIPVLMRAPGEAGDRMVDHFRADATFQRENGAWRLQRHDHGPAAHPDLALLLGTSGTTGSSKVVRLSAANLQNNAEAIADYLAIRTDDIGITTLPLSYSYGLSVLHSHLAAGASLSLYDGSVADEGFADRVTRDGVTGIPGVPFTFELLVRAGVLDDLPRTVRYMTQAGGAMPVATTVRIHERLRARGIDLFAMYGQTEATARISYLPPSMLPEHAGAIGQAIPGGHLWCVDADGAPCPLGQEGELIYEGPNVMMGYAEHREELALPAGEQTLSTGDLGVEGPPGIFRITGRKKRIVKPFGLRISLDDIERRLQDVGVTGHVAGDDEVIAIALTYTADETRARDALASLAIDPSIFSYRAYDTIPRLENGKVAYRDILRDAITERDATEVAGIAAVAELYARIGRKAEVADQDTFASLGGDSLSYVHASIAIEDALGRSVNGWEHLTFGEIRRRAADVAQDGRTRSPTRWVDSDIVLRAAAILLVTLQHALGGLMGGSDVLMLLAGYNFSRFRRETLDGGQPGKVFRSFFLSYVALYIAIMLFYFAAKRMVLWKHLLFVSTFFAEWGGSLNIYWFFETLTWVVASVCLLYGIPPLRRFATRQPLVSSLSFLAGAIALRLLGTIFFDPATSAMRTADQMLLYFAAGWAIAVAPPLLRLAIGAVCVVASATAWGMVDTHVLYMTVAIVMLAFVARVPLPSPVASGLFLVASASFYIYLLNVVPMYLIDEKLGAQHGRYWWLHLLLGLALGLATYFIANNIRRTWWSHRDRFVAAMPWRQA